MQKIALVVSACLVVTAAACSNVDAQPSAAGAKRPVTSPASSPSTDAATVSSEYQLDYGRRAPISLHRNSATSDWLVLMPGSGCNFYDVEDSRFLRWLMQAKAYNVLIIGKAGADLGRDDDNCRVDEFQHSSIRSERIKDVHTIMHDLIPDDSSVLLAAISEGAYIAPDVALKDKRVKAFIDLSGNTQSWITEEIMSVPAGPEREKLSRFFDREVRGNNSFTKYYVDWTYAYLNSYDTRQSYESMKALTIPVIWLNGDQDETLWVEGAREDAISLINDEHKTNIQYHWLAGANHGLECVDKAKTCDEEALAAKVRSLIVTFAAQNF